LIEFLEGGFCGLDGEVPDLFEGEGVAPLEGEAAPPRCGEPILPEEGALLCGAPLLDGDDIEPPLEGDDIEPPLDPPPPWFILWDKTNSGLNVSIKRISQVNKI
jgi:hypothetical protein